MRAENLSGVWVCEGSGGLKIGQIKLGKHCAVFVARARLDAVIKAGLICPPGGAAFAVRGVLKMIFNVAGKSIYRGLLGG